MRPASIAGALAVALAGTATDASPLFSATGSWTGAGRIAAAIDQPMEPARCRIEMHPGAGSDEVDITGRCALAGGARDISMRYVRSDGNSVRAGFWSPTGGISVQYGGVETGESIALQALEPVEMDGVSYFSRVTLTFLSDTAFSFEQIVRRDGTPRWVRIVDMRFEQ